MSPVRNIGMAYSSKSTVLFFFFLVFHLKTYIRSPHVPGVSNVLPKVGDVNDVSDVTGGALAAGDAGNVLSVAENDAQTVLKPNILDHRKDVDVGHPTNKESKVADENHVTFQPYSKGAITPKASSMASAISRLDPNSATAKARKIQTASRYLSKAVEFFKKRLPKLIQRIKFFIISTRGDLRDISTFNREFKVASINRKFRLLAETFDSLKANRIRRSSEKFKEWIRTIEEVMEVDDKLHVKHMKLEAIVLVETSKLIIKASKDKANSPKREGLQALNSLLKKLYDRLDANRPSWREDTGYQLVPGATELLNMDEDLFSDPKKVEALRKKLSNDPHIGKTFQRIDRPIEMPMSQISVSSEIDRLFSWVKDETLPLKSSAEITESRESLNTFPLEKRTAACHALWYLHQAAKNHQKHLLNRFQRQFVMNFMDEKFGPDAFKGHFLYPHFRLLSNSVASKTKARPPKIIHISTGDVVSPTAYSAELGVPKRA
ncbi:hypothetical protein O181_035114 [Austropuccinia psidii MF-1]|uniref:Uncharacterized protein n=1 Tax=Austropuccinia psidii MF-1 TaxID=1389203 RepID=A0A9Q3HA79_9BASI|nr:hypothetical protein [Austropuccinia psidii MF-1]